MLFLFGDSDQNHEVSLALSGGHGVRAPQPSPNLEFSSATGGFTTVTFLPGIKGLITVWESDSQIVLFSDPVTAATFWAPTIPSSSSSHSLKNFWQFGSNTTLLVGGPYLVRNATISGSGELALRGDLNTSAMLTVIAPSQVRSVSWNGELVPVDFVKVSDDSGVAASSSAIMTGRLDMKVQASGIRIPKLTNWKFKDSLPEIQANFDDGTWIVANHTTTNLSPKPSFGDGRVLYGTSLSLTLRRTSQAYLYLF